MKKLYGLERAVRWAAAALLIAVLILSAASNTSIIKKESKTACHMADNVTRQMLESPASPAGVIEEFLFTLDHLEDVNTLAFFCNHSNIEVYLDEQQVYYLPASEGAIRTHGGIWVLVPVTPDNLGSEIRVLLEPVYSDYRENPEFLLGSELDIYTSMFRSAVPELVLSFCVILGGFFLLAIAIYNKRKYRTAPRLFSLSLLAISSGLWRFTYGEFTYLLFENHTVLVYYISVTSLMLLTLTMLNASELSEHEKGGKLIRLLSLVYCTVYGAELFLQLTGVLDLRQMLKTTHVAIILSAGILCLSALQTLRSRIFSPGKTSSRNYSWMLGLGAVTDLVLYYFDVSSGGMLLTLTAILCYSAAEGFRLISSYINQQYALKEMETQLTLSRTATMMSQIRSHFVFNLLNAISGMCKYDPEMADETIVRFARYLRSNINIMEDDKPIPFSTDLRQLEDYVILEQVRFGDRITFLTDIEEDQFMIPPLILQPVVENSIKHGLSRKPEGGTIILRTRTEGENILITVEDDGIGFEPKELEKGASVGMRNIRFRLQHLMNGTLEFESTPGVGTVATITIPKKETRL